MKNMILTYLMPVTWKDYNDKKLLGIKQLFSIHLYCVNLNKHSQILEKEETS